MQSKLDRFFTIHVHHKKNKKTCFIYDPTHRSAYFDYQPFSTDHFVKKSASISLYYRSSSKEDIVLPIMPKEYIPLLKSNLQKAIRRCESTIALQSALALIQQDLTEFLRRLPIIYVEDVTVLDSLPMVVWLMMADKEYKITQMDIKLLLQIVYALCNTHEYYMDTDEPIVNIVHEDLEHNDNKDILLALYYRMQYGGMKGDMQLLHRAILYYKSHPILPTEYNSIDCSVFSFMEILAEAIDFHPYPQLLSILYWKTKVEKETIKKYMWFAESGINVRKEYTMQLSQQYEVTHEWRAIQLYLDDARIKVINGHQPL